MLREEKYTQIDRILEIQRRFFQENKTRDFSARIQSLSDLEQSIVNHRDDILEALEADLGKPGVEAFVAEYHFLLEELRLIKKSLKKWLKPKRVSSQFYLQPCRAELRPEPFGVTLILAPWNYPIQLALSPMIAALAAGNTVVLKPSEMSRASEALIEKIIKETFPPELVTVVTGDADVAECLLDQAFDFVFFTGSTSIGRVVAQKAAKQLAPCVLELGGKCPAIVEQSADIQQTAVNLLTGKFFNGGQTCFAPDFAAVHESVYDLLIEEIKKVFTSVEWSPEMAHVINHGHYSRLEKLLGSGRSVIQQGEDDSGKLKFAPRILPEVTWEDEIMKEEIFGPILPILRYSDENDLLDLLREYGSPLALYLFSKDAEFNERMMAGIRSGGVCINDTMKQGAHLQLPFGGVGESGYGRYRGKSGVLTFSYERAVLKRPTWAPGWFDPRPPYGDKLTWMKRFMR